MMASYKDDFHDRVRKHLQPKFRESVIPSHLLPYLHCLTTVDEERVKAKETNCGPTLAADELFDLIIRRPNWIEDLSRALRDPEVKLDFLADDIEKMIREVPMRWDINGFVDNYGKACFDGNCGTIEPMQHDEGEMLSQATSSAAVTETPQPQLELSMELLKEVKEQHVVKEVKEEHCMEVSMQHDEDKAYSQLIQCATGSELLEQRMEFLKLDEQDIDNELKPVQRMKELKEIDVDKTVPKVKTGSDDHLLPTENRDSVQSIEERREHVRLNIIEKIWSMVKQPGDVPVAINYVDRINLQITGIEKGSLLFKVKVDTLDDLKRMQDLVRYGGMKKILDKELVEKNMEIFKDLASAERLKLLSVNSKLYVHQSDLERCKAFMSTRKDGFLGLGNIGSLPTENFQNERDVLVMKQLKEMLPPLCINILEDSFLTKRLPRFFDQNAQAVNDTLKRKIDSPTISDIEGMVMSIALIEQEEGRSEEKDSSFKREQIRHPGLQILKRRLSEIRERRLAGGEYRRQDREGVFVLFLKWVENELISFFNSLEENDLKLLVQATCELVFEAKDLTHFASLPVKENHGRLFRRFSDINVDFNTPLSSEAYNRMEYLGILKKDGDTFEFVSDILKSIMSVYLMEFYYKAAILSFYEAFQTSENMLTCDADPLGEGMEKWRNVYFRRLKTSTKSKDDEGQKGKTECSKGDKLGEVLNGIENMIKRVELGEASLPLAFAANVILPFLLLKSDTNSSADAISIQEKRERLSKYVQCLKDIRSPTSYKFACNLFANSQYGIDRETFSDFWMTDSRCSRTEFLRKGFGALKSPLSVNKNTISIKVQSFDEICNLMYLTNNVYLYTLLPHDDAILKNDIQMEVFVKVPSFNVVTGSSQGLDQLTEFLGRSKLTTVLKLSSSEIFASDITRHLETGNFANITHLSLFDTKMGEPVSRPFGFRYMPRLQSLDLHGCDLGDKGISIIGEELGLLKELKEINVAKTGISAEGLQELSNGLVENHGIRALRLQNNTIGVEGAIVLSGWLKRLYLLETLNMSGCGIENIGAKYISKSFVSKVLRQMSMRENEIIKEGSVTFFENMKSMRMIEHLDFGRNKIFDDWDITAVEEPSKGDLADGPEVYIASFLQEQTHWSHLNLWACNLGASRIFQFPEKFHSMKELVYLCLQSNQINDQFAEDIGACLKMHCEHVRYVILKHNRIGNVGAKAIADGIADKKYITELQMDRNQIEKDGVSALLIITLKLEHSMTLDVSCNSLAKFDIHNLEQELSLEMKTPENDSGGVKQTTTIYVPRDKEHKIQIYM